MQYNQKNIGTLIISRHSESEWNLLGKWTGTTDVNLTSKGHQDAEKIGDLIQDIVFDGAYTSDLKRTHQTLDGILRGAGRRRTKITRVAHRALTERDYGDLTGKNKWQVKEEIGDEAFNGIRRGWDYPVPGGENLRDVHSRVVPYFEATILPRLLLGENILVVAHGNSIRALIKEIESVPDEKAAELEMPLGTVLIYGIEPSLKTWHVKEERKIGVSQGNA